MASPYMEGMQVMIRPDLQRGSYENESGGSAQHCNDTMPRYAGRTATITFGHAGGTAHKIDIDDGHWGWSDKMFIPVVTDKKALNAMYITEKINAETYKKLYDSL